MQTQSVDLASWRQWVREERPRLGALRVGDEYTVNPSRILKELEDFWGPVYDSVSEPQSVPSFRNSVTQQFALAPLTGDDLRRSFLQKTRGVAGAEGLTCKLFSLLGTAGWDWLSDIFESYKRGIAWDPSLLWIRLAILTKRGSPDPPGTGQIRIIAIESIAIRTWASCRAAQLMGWLMGLIGDGVLGAVDVTF